MKINCISCGHTLDLRDAYDDYDGKVRCFICGAMLTIRTCDGQVKSVDLPSSPLPAAPSPCVDLSGGISPISAGIVSVNF
jgi:hypothetical protein